MKSAFEGVKVCDLW